MIEWEESPWPSEQFDLNIADCCAMIQNIFFFKFLNQGIPDIILNWDYFVWESGPKFSLSFLNPLAANMSPDRGCCCCCCDD